jgi:hypothetical protein
MKFAIETARDQHRVKDESGLKAKQAAFVAKQIAGGMRSIRIHESAEPKAAKINHGVWLLECDCGAGVAVDPSFSAGYCFGCGAIHTRVEWPAPEDRLNIEHVILARPKTVNRNWDPDETLIDVLVTNVDHGVNL